MGDECTLDSDELTEIVGCIRLNGALEALEDRLDLLDALDSLADYRANGGVDIEELKADLGG